MACRLALRDGAIAQALLPTSPTTWRAWSTTPGRPMKPK
jgi:hypothetical protein